MTGEPTRYDQVAYPARAFAQTHPNRLATLARLSGLEPAPVENCRVLELGCGEAANLIPMAVELAHSRFVGVDAAALSIAAGQEVVRALGLSNIELMSRPLEDLDVGLGKFDYVIAHGVYSWVPEAVRDALLAAFKRHLAPHGVAYVSYSAYPGGYFRELVREMMLFHAGDIDDPALRVGRGIEFVRFVRSLHGDRTPYAAVLDLELERLKNDLWVSRPRFVVEVSERPVASPLCRLQVQHGDMVTSLRHLMMRIEDSRSRHLLKLLDGTRTRAELLAEMRSEFVTASASHASATAPDMAELEAVLGRMARSGLLLA